MNLEHTPDDFSGINKHIFKCEKCGVPIITVGLNNGGADGSYVLIHMGQVTAKIICKLCYSVVDRNEN